MVDMCGGSVTEPARKEALEIPKGKQLAQKENGHNPCRGYEKEVERGEVDHRTHGSNGSTGCGLRGILSSRRSAGRSHEDHGS